MSELINRQKLIEAVEKKYQRFIVDDRDVAHNRAISDVLEIIKVQPPAESPVGIDRRKLIEELERIKHDFWYEDCLRPDHDCTREDDCAICALERVREFIESQSPAYQRIPCSDNTEEYIDTGCAAEIIHTVGEKKIPKHFKFIKDDEIVKEFILCKNPVGQAGYYEAVAGVFYRIDMEGNSND